MSGEHAGYNGNAEGGRKYHHGSQHQHSSGSVSPPPRSQSPPSVTSLKKFHQEQSAVYELPQQKRALSASQPGSPTMYKVSPITCENNEMGTFNPQSPFRSMAPSQSYFFDASTLTSPNQQIYRNERPEASAASPSPPRFRRVITSPQSSASLHSQEVLYSSQQSLHQQHAITSATTSADVAAFVPRANTGGQTESTEAPATAAEFGFTAVLTNTNVLHPTNRLLSSLHYRGSGAVSSATTSPETQLQFSSKKVAMGGMMMTSPLTPGGGRPHFSAQCSCDGWPLQQHQQQQQHGPPSFATTVAAGRCSTSPGSAASSPATMPRKQLENGFLPVSGSLESRLPTAAAVTTPSSSVERSIQTPSRLGVAVVQQRTALPLHDRAIVSPPPPPHASVVTVTQSPLRESTPLTDTSLHAAAATTVINKGSATRANEPIGGRWVTPQRPHRGGSVDVSDGFQSPDSAPSSSDTPNTHASAPPPLSTRAPAMYGVIGLPYTRGEDAAGGVSSTGSVGSNTSNATKTIAVSPTTQFRAVPSSSRAPAVIKLRSPLFQQQQVEPQQHVEGHHQRQRQNQQYNARDLMSATTSHVDPAFGAASSGATPITEHPLSGSSDFSARYRQSISCSAHNNYNSNTSSGRAPPKMERTEDVHGQAAVVPNVTAVTAGGRVTGSPCITPLHPPPPQRIHSSSGSGNSSSSDSGGEDGHSDAMVAAAEEPQHVVAVAPAAVVAARARAPVSRGGGAAVAAAMAEAVRKPGLRLLTTPTQISNSNSNSNSNANATYTPTSASGRRAPQLTAETVLPVAAQEEQRLSSSPTDTTERSSSNSRQLTTAAAAATSSTSSKSSGKTAGSPLSSGRTQKLPQGSNFSGIGARQRRGSTTQLPQRQSPLCGIYSGNCSPVVTRATAISASSDLNGQSSSGSAHCRRGSASSTSVSSAKSAVPALIGYSFVSSRAHLQRYIDQWRDRFEEDKTAYKEGGYLTVIPGKVVHSRYVLIQKLGWGEFSTVWLAYDTKHATLGRGATQAFVAVKVAKCRSSVQEATRYEVSLLRYMEARLPPHAAVTNIVDCFDVQGEFGLHTCMVMPLCGPNLLSIIDRVKGQRGRRSADDVRLVKEIIISVLISLHELSELNVVHTDIKPENVLCCAVDTKLLNSMEKFCSYNKDRSHMISTEEFRAAMAQRTSDHLVCLADFGLSALLEPPGSAATWTALCPNVKPSLLAPLMRCKKNFNVTKSGVMENLRGTLIQTREYRAPEVLLGLDFTCATDVWSVGCMAFELITGNFLMDPKKKTRDAREMDVEHLAMMMQLIGPLPEEITDIRVRNNDYYEAVINGIPVPRRTTRRPPEYLHRFVDKDGNFIYAARYRAYPRRNLEMELEPYLGFREARLAANFVLSCLCCYDPSNRPSAKKLLGHVWLQGIGTAGKDKTGFR